MTREEFEDATSQIYYKIGKVCSNILHNQDDAMDATQQTFLRAWQYQKDYRGDSTFYTWVTRIAVNVCRTQLRKQRTRPEGWMMPNAISTLENDTVFREYLHSHQPNPQEQVLRAEFLECLDKAMWKLTRNQEVELRRYLATGLYQRPGQETTKYKTRLHRAITRVIVIMRKEFKCRV